MAKLRGLAEWRLFGVMYRAAPGSAVLWWALVVIRGALPAAFAVAMGALVSAVQRGDELAGWLSLIGLLFIAMQAAGPIHDAVSANLGAQTSSWLHERLLEACIGPPGLAHLEDPELADELAAARDFDIGLTGPSMVVSMPSIGGGFAALAGGAAQAVLLAGYRWWAPILVGGAWLSTHHFLKAGAIWRSRDSDDVKERQRRADYAYRVTVHAPAAKEVRLFGLTDWVVSGFASIRRHLLDLSWEERRLRWRPTWWAIVLIVAANALFFWSLARDASDGRIGLGALVVFAQAAIGASALAFGEVDWWLRTTAQPVPMVLGLVDRMAPVGELPMGDKTAAGRPASEIQFADVGFGYPNGGQVLDGFNLTIPAGRSIAIVGQNGAGKTTLAKLVCRLYDPTTGAILVDGDDVRSFDIHSWRRRVAAVFQDFVRYELSLRDNVAPGGRADDADVRGALADARAADLADLDTILSKSYEGGTDLSGGQWQRVALARALCAVRLGAGVVILDEPTAQLDVRGEAEIFERLLEATRGCTTILISHRFSTVRRADLICVLEAGHVVELGSHDELIALGGRYRTMFELQASRFYADDEPVEALA